MATISKTVTKLTSYPPTAYVILWETLTTTNDVGDGAEMIAYSDRSVQVTGTFGTGGSLSLEGSNDGTNWVILDDPQGSAVTFTSAGLLPVGPLTRYVRPHVTAGDGTTDLDMYLLVSGVKLGG